MSSLFSLLPYPIIVLIVALPIIFGGFLVIKFRKELKVTGTVGIVFALILMPLSGLLLNAIKRFHILEDFGNYIFVLSLIFLLTGIILLCNRTYNEKIKYNLTYKKIFWIYSAIFVFVILFIVFAIFMANLSR